MTIMQTESPRREGPDHRLPLTAWGRQIGWAYVTPDGWATRAEVTDSTWLDVADLPAKALRRELSNDA